MTKSLSGSKDRTAPRRLTRRSVLMTGAAAAATLAAPWVTTKARAAGTINLVLNQGLLAKLWVDELHPRFEKETGATINLQQSVTSQMLAMLKTQKNDPPDLMQFSEAGVFIARDEGLLRAHNPKNIRQHCECTPGIPARGELFRRRHRCAAHPVLQHQRSRTGADRLGRPLGSGQQGQDRNPAGEMEQRRAHGHQRGADRHRQAFQGSPV